jgi:hypothetical protein
VRRQARRAAAAVAVALLATMVSSATTLAGPGAAFLCNRATTSAEHSVANPLLNEISGVVASHRYRNVIWAHNDSGDRPRIYAVGQRGGHLGSVSVAPAAIDWEDMAMVPWGPGTRDRLYLADFGDNATARETITIYRTVEPLVRAGTVRRRYPTTAITLRYPDGPHDAEALLVDPVRKDLIIVTKEPNGVSGIYAVTPPITGNRVLTLRKVGEFDANPWADAIAAGLPDDAPLLSRAVGNRVTAGDVSRDGTVVALRTYSGVVLFNRDPALPLWTAFRRGGCVGPSLPEGQGEAIAFDPTGRGYFTISEGVRPTINRTRLG